MCQKTPSLPWFSLISTAAIALLTPRNWWFLATSLLSSPLRSSKRMKFSTRSRSFRLSQVPRIIVSRLMRPGSFSSSIFFHSAKCSKPAVMLPILALEPFDRMMKPLYQKTCGIVSL